MVIHYHTEELLKYWELCLHFRWNGTGPMFVYAVSQEFQGGFPRTHISPCLLQVHLLLAMQSTAVGGLSALCSWSWL